MKHLSEEKKLELEILAKYLSVMGVRNNTELEDLHCGTTPSSKSGDYSDVKVVSPYGEIEWNNLSRISDTEMRSLMLSIESAITIALYAYESLNSEDKELLLQHVLSQRSYDCD